MSCSNIVPTSFPKCEDLPQLDTSHLHKVLMDAVIEKHNFILTEILKQCLKKDSVTTEDFARMTKVTYPEDQGQMDYDIAFDGVPVGRVYHIFDVPSFTITFKPKKGFTNETGSDIQRLE